MRYSEIAEIMRRQGYAPTQESKHPAQQLLNSLWTRLTRDRRFVKVGRGTWDLAERQQRQH